MWIINALIVHLLLLGSIFVIYFRSPIIKGLEPQSLIFGEPPANRLVLIVTDGLRAESFFQNNCSDIPKISSLFTRPGPGGLVGISHTRVPTESRPGHIALIAGLYEDPSAVTRGWKENPIDFDTLFNRSSHTYAWGANDVLHIFARVSDEKRLVVDAYNHDLDFSGRNKTFALDEWVFERVRLLLSRKGTELRQQQHIVFFLHLLGLDSAGHIHKPGLPLFLENLHNTDQGILDIYEYFEKIFPDGRTAYVLTSDHGMSNTGSHGAGDPLETETPFFLWGAGINKQAPNYDKTFAANGHANLPLHELEQAQLTPLMSALLGLPPPMNNFGILPMGFLNVSAEYEARAVHSNALQILEQFQKLLHQHQRGFFSDYLRKFEKLDFHRIASYKRAIDNFYSSHDYASATQSSYSIMRIALEGIDYYHSYYSNALLLSTSATFIGWIIYLLQLMLTRPKHDSRSLDRTRRKHFSTILCILALLLTTFGIMQRISFDITFYLALPAFMMMLLIVQNGVDIFAISKSIFTSSLLPIVAFILCAEFLVFSFFERKLIAFGFLLFAFVNNYRQFANKDIRFYVWLLLVVALATFPLLPPSVGYTNTPLFLLGAFFTMARPFIIVKSRLSWHAKLFAIICLLNATLCLYQHSYQMGISIISQILSWCYLVYSIAAIVLHNPDISLKHRVELILFHLSTLYCLFCISYESLFVVMLASELVLNLSAEESRMCAQLDKPISVMSLGNRNSSNHTTQLLTSFRLAFTILLYAFFSFFGTGNIASVSSFDPNIIRCFITTFSPFVIMTLVILKLIIPVVMNISIIFGISSFARAYERQIFICLLLISDVMGLNFLFFVRNHGSWLEIGTSISHFVIMQVTTVILLLLTCVAKVFLRINDMKMLHSFKLK